MCVSLLLGKSVNHAGKGNIFFEARFLCELVHSSWVIIIMGSEVLLHEIDFYFF